MSSAPSGSVIVSAPESTAVAGSKLAAACTALPSADAVESVLFSDFTVTLPLLTPILLPATIVRASGISASELDCVTVTATAPATCTLALAPEPWPDEADVAPGLVSVLAVEPPEVLRSPANDPCLLTSLSTPPLLDPLSGTSLPPATLALASARFMPTARALNAMAPPAVRSRRVVALTLSVLMVSATETPTPVSPDSVSPLASVATEPSCSAVALNLPPSVVVAPLLALTRACVLLSETEIEMIGVIAVLPAAPPSAAVSISFLLLASIVMSLAPASVALVPMLAVVVVWPMLSAIDAPMPKLPRPDCVALALTLLATKFSAFSSTSPSGVSVTVALSASVADAIDVPTLIASEPAMPVVTPLTPEVALAPKLEVVSLLPTVGTSACTTRPSALMVARPTRAMFSTLATFTATAMPTPVPVGTPPRLCAAPAPTALKLTRPVVLTPSSAWALVPNSMALLPSIRT